MTFETVEQAMEELARMAREKNGVLSVSGLWFDTPADENCVGWGIVNGRRGIAIVSVPRDR